MQGIRLVALLAALLAWCPPRASAQLADPPRSPSAEDISSARDAFLRGMEFAGDRRFEEARREFVHSYSLSGSPVALFNLASTLASLERHREAVVAFERLLVAPALDATIRSQAEPMLAHSATQVARVRLHGEVGAARLRVDRGPPRPFERSPEVVVLDPGPHALEASRDGAESWTWRGALAPGEALDLAVELLTVDVTAPRVVEPGGIDPYAALGVSVAIGVGLAVIVGAIIADAEAQLSPRTGLVFELP